MRVLTNTTIGIAGLFDPATSLGFERRSEDLGQTLGRWGLEPGPYLVLPLFGSSDIRDAIALPADTYVTPALLVPSTWQKIGVDTVGVIDTRAGLLGASQMLDELALRPLHLHARRLHHASPQPGLRRQSARPARRGRHRRLEVRAGARPAPPAAPRAAPSRRCPPRRRPRARSRRAPRPARAWRPRSPRPPADAAVATAAGARRPRRSRRQPVPGDVTPAPLPASAPTLPVPRSARCRSRRRRPPRRVMSGRARSRQWRPSRRAVRFFACRHCEPSPGDRRYGMERLSARKDKNVSTHDFFADLRRRHRWAPPPRSRRPRPTP